MPIKGRACRSRERLRGGSQARRRLGSLDETAESQMARGQGVRQGQEVPDRRWQRPVDFMRKMASSTYIKAFWPLCEKTGESSQPSEV